MSITLAKTVRLSGTPIAAGVTLTLPAAEENRLVAEGSATWFGRSLAAPDVAAPSLLVIGDSILAQAFNVPNESYGCTKVAGSYTSSGGTRTTGITNVYAENPCRLKFRAAHNLTTNDEVMIYDIGVSNHPLITRRWPVTVVDDDEITIPFDARNVPEFTSAGASTDGMAFVDMSMTNFSPLPWFEFFSGRSWTYVSMQAVPGRSSAQAAAAIQADIKGLRYSDGLVLLGRNDSAYDAVSLEQIYQAMVSACDRVWVGLPFPDDNWATPANDGAASKIALISAFWHAKQLTDARVTVVDLFSVMSDASRTLQSTRDEYIGSDGVHPQANGAMVCGYALAKMIDSPVRAPRKSVARIGSSGVNILTNGRLSGNGGTVGSGMSGAVATSWTVGSRSSANVTGGYTYPVRTPARARKHSTAYAQGDTMFTRPFDGYWYVCKTAGTSDSSLPAGYASATLWDFGTGVTDGTAVFVRIPVFTDEVDWRYWQLLECAASSGSNENISLFQNITLPGGQTVIVGDRIRGSCDVVLADCVPNYLALRVGVFNSTSTFDQTTQIACAHALGPQNLLSEWPFGGLIKGTLITPQIRVRTGALALRWQVVPGFSSTEKLRVFVSDAMLEKVTF